MTEPRYVRHKESGRKHVWHELYKQDDFEPWTEDGDVIEGVVKIIPDTVVPIGTKTQKVKKAGLIAPADEALSIDASRRLP